jgi:predicted nucleotidyltransferase
MARLARSPLRSPLDLLFARPSQLAALRVLQDSREGMSGRAIARQARVNHQACAVALRRLEEINLIQRIGAGRTQLIRLNFDHHLVKELILPLLRKERELVSHIRREIAQQFKDTALAVTLFGSVARGEDVPGSDVDLLIVTKATDKPRAMKRAEQYNTGFQQRYGMRLSPIVMTPGEAARKMNASKPLLKNILADGIDLLPRRLREVLP